MSQPLPTHGFRWLRLDEIEVLEMILDGTAILPLLDVDSEDGYIFEVDLQYPHHFHERHNDYPLASERL